MCLPVFVVLLYFNCVFFATFEKGVGNRGTEVFAMFCTSTFVVQPNKNKKQQIVKCNNKDLN